MFKPAQSFSDQESEHISLNHIVNLRLQDVDSSAKNNEIFTLYSNGRVVRNVQLELLKCQGQPSGNEVIIFIKEAKPAMQEGVVANGPGVVGD